MNILGISALYHDSAAALVVDGQITAAAQEERFTRKKHDFDFPHNAISYCLREAGLEQSDVDYVVFYDKPILKFNRLLETYITYAPLGIRSFLKAMPLWLKQKLHMRREIKKALPNATNAKFLFTDHHEAHAAAAFLPSPFEEAAILTLDGVGEWATSTIGIGKGNRIELQKELRFPHSLGLLYSAFTYYCGFKVNSGEYKLMGLAPYGSPKFKDLIQDNLIDLKADGSFRMDMQYFNYCEGLTMTNKKFDNLMGRVHRSPETSIDQFFMDIAASIQAVTEEIVLRMAKNIRESTGMKNLCLAGGVVLNCVANGKLLREKIFDNIWIQPGAGDAGSALGTTLFVWHQLLNNSRTVQPEGDSQAGSLLGPKFTTETAQELLNSRNAEYQLIEDEQKLLERVVKLISQGKVVGWFQGRMEFGPRALGCRSIIGDPRNMEMQSKINLKIKFRESFRPFAPVVLHDHANEYFDIDIESPYMLLVAPLQNKHRLKLTAEEQKIMTSAEDLQERVKIPRSDIPAITHLDYSARVQTIDPIRHGRFHRLMETWNKETGCPVLVNTSFNIRGEPIVCTPEDAYRCFMLTDMDVFVVEDLLLLKEDQPEENLKGREEYIARFELD